MPLEQKADNKEELHLQSHVLEDFSNPSNTSLNRQQFSFQHFTILPRIIIRMTLIIFNCLMKFCTNMLKYNNIVFIILFKADTCKIYIT